MIVFDNADPIEPPAPVTKTVLAGIVSFIDAHVRVDDEEIDPQKSIRRHNSSAPLQLYGL
jgi:hypothetical protein